MSTKLIPIFEGRGKVILGHYVMESDQSSEKKLKFTVELLKLLKGSANLILSSEKYNFKNENRNTMHYHKK